MANHHDSLHRSNPATWLCGNKHYPCDASARQSALESVAHHRKRGEVMKEELLANLLPALTLADRSISCASWLEDQKCALVFYKHGGFKRVPADGEGLVFVKEIVSGLVGE